MLSKFKKNQKGFTLIELLIVVAIIGILAAIAIPQFAQYRQRAFNSAATSDIRTIRTSVESFYAERYAYPVEDVGWTVADGATPEDALVIVGNGDADNPNVDVPLSARVAAYYNGTASNYVIATRNVQGTRTFGTSQEKSAIFWDDSPADGTDPTMPAPADEIDWETAGWERL